jgi:anti-sigma factor RsiW
MNCGEAKNLIQLYMDSELDARNTLDVQQHLESCVACSRLLDAYLRQDQTLKQVARSEAINSDAVRERIRGVIRNQFSGRRSRWQTIAIWRRVIALAAMTIIAVLLLLRGALLPGLNESVYAAVASDHAAHCSIEKVMGAITSRDELDRLGAVYGKLSATPDLSVFGFNNPRGTICKVRGTDFFHLVFYNQEEQGLSVFVRPHSQDIDEHRLTLLQEGGYQVVSVSRSGVDLLVVSSPDEKQVSAIAEAIAAQL